MRKSGEALTATSQHHTQLAGGGSDEYFDGVDPLLLLTRREFPPFTSHLWLLTLHAVGNGGGCEEAEE